MKELFISLLIAVQGLLGIGDQPQPATPIDQPEGQNLGASVLRGYQGGTGIGSATAGEVGTCLKVSDDSPFTYTLGTCGTGGGSGGGSWSTTTSLVSGQWFNYPNETDDIVVIGSNSSTTAEFYYDPNVFNLFVKSASSTIAGPLDVIGSFRLPSISQGSIYAGSNGLLQTTATGTITGGDSLTVDATRYVLGGNLDIDCDVASGSQSGCLSSADWTTFNNKAGFAYPFPSAATTTRVTFSGGLDFTYSSSTYSSFITASTTNLSFGGVFGNSWDDFCVSITGSADLCDGNDASGGGSGSSKWATSTTDSDAIHTAAAAKVGISTTSPHGKFSVASSTNTNQGLFQVFADGSIAVNPTSTVQFSSNTFAAQPTSTNIRFNHKDTLIGQGVGGNANGPLYYTWGGALDDYPLTLIGYNSGHSLQASTTGDINGAIDFPYGLTALGAHTLEDATAAFEVTAVGTRALEDCTTCNETAAFGMNAGGNITTGDNNVLVGNDAMPLANASDNTVVGHAALFFHTGTVGKNTVIGKSAGLNLGTGSNNIIIGQRIDLPASGSSNMISIGNLIYGANLSNLTNNSSAISSGQVGIATSSPAWMLQVSSSTSSNTFRPQLALSDQAGATDAKHWTLSSQGGNFYIASATDAFATTSISALEISGSGFGTTTLRGLNIDGQATSTSDVGFNITTGCYAVSGTCISGGGGSGSSSGNAGAIQFSAGSGNFNSDENNLFWNDTTNKLGIGTSTPAEGLTLASTTKFFQSTLGNSNEVLFYLAPSSTPFSTIAPAAVGPLQVSTEGVNTNRIVMTHHGATSVGNVLTGFATRGTYVSPTATQSGDTLVGLAGGGYGDTGYFDTRGVVEIIAGNTWTDTSQGTSIRFRTTPIGSQTVSTKMLVNGNGEVGIGTTTPRWILQLASSTKPQLTLTDTTNIDHWSFRNAGGNLYVSTSSPTTFASTSISALEISGSGFGTTTLRGLNIDAQATSTSDVGFNITTGCYAIGGTCVGGGSGTGLTSYDAWTHPAAGISATTSQLTVAGLLSTASSTIVGNATTTGTHYMGTASTTDLIAYGSVNLFGGGAKTTANALCVQLTGSADLCDGGDASGGGGGSTKWATTTTGNGIYPSGGTGIDVVIGRLSTTTDSDLEVQGTTTASNFVATSTTATSTFAGAVGIATSSPYMKGLSIVGNIFSQQNWHTGEQIGTINPNSDDATILLWYPYEGSFRAGEWDIPITNAQIGGSGSVAFGYNTIASQDGAAAFGFDTEATDFYAFALGTNTHANNDQSFAGGDSETTVNGTSAFGYGTGVKVSGDGAVAFGSFTVASGTDSVAIGLRNKAGIVDDLTGNYTAAIGGSDNQAIEDYSFVIGGLNNVADGIASGILGGDSSSVTGDNSFAIGRYLSSTGNQNILLGSGINSGTKLSSTLTNTFEVGFNSTIPTFVVTAASGAGTIGKVGVGTTTPTYNFTVTSSTALTDGAGIAQWVTRNAGGNLYFSTTTVAGTATTSISALEVSGTGFGTTTLRGLNISGQATSTSNVGFNITSGCYAIAGTCVGGGSGSGLTSYDAWTHPAAGQSATTSLMLLYGQASSTLFSANWLKVGGTASTTIDNAGNVTYTGLLSGPYSSSTVFASFQIASSSKYLADGGSATVPTYTFGNDSDTGIFSNTAGSIEFANNGSQGWEIDSNLDLKAISSSANLRLSGNGTVSNPDLNGNLDQDTGLNLSNDNTMVFVNGGRETARFTDLNAFGIGTTTPRWLLQLATSTRPQLSLSDGTLTSDHWTMRSIGSQFYFATASPTTFATTSVFSPLWLDTGGITNLFGIKFSTTTKGFLSIGATGQAFVKDVATTTVIEINDCTPKTTATDFFPGGSWWQPLDMTNDFIGAGAWTFQEATSSEVTCFVKVPKNLGNPSSITLNTAFVSTTTSQANVALDIYVSSIDPASASLDRTAANLTNILAGSTTGAHLLKPAATAWTSVSTSTSVTPTVLSSDVLIVRYRRYASDADDANTGDLYLWKQWLEVTLNAN